MRNPHVQPDNRWHTAISSFKSPGSEASRPPEDLNEAPASSSATSVLTVGWEAAHLNGPPDLPASVSARSSS
ncbi:Hypothetical protein NTJ_13042 [Nesidiocoris tenuis]|uniref:Uncharacterized protein n=1 Tax=Nesidiocoris tenuis TaxID=355587 RepID=A0ABN7B754_9HEMI|nr:Hypothetical protein NTJ_13042 [Nesidiocoris tenuis]